MIIVRTGAFNLSLLTEELAAIPDNIINDIDGFAVFKYSASYNGTTLKIESTDDLAKAIETVIAAHNPAGLSKNQLIAQSAPTRKAALDTKFKTLGFTADDLKFLASYALDQEDALKGQ